MEIVYNPDIQTWKRLTTRPAIHIETMENVVKSIFNGVKIHGDAAVKKYTHEFDHAEINELQVTDKEMADAENKIGENLKAAIQTAYANIYRFHASQQISTIKKVKTSPGVVCWQNTVPIEKVGLYIPGGSAPLFSTVLMLAVPAKIAGCGEVVMCTPPSADGSINPTILYAAKIAGVTQVFKTGGIQAIAAMTFGTETISVVYKIFGPGNQYVMAAKMEAFRHGVAIDLPAGPSEVMVVADRTANPAFVAADMLSQAEHGRDSQALMVTWERSIIDRVAKEIERQLEVLSRKEIACAALENSALVYVDGKEEALYCINSYAPEHLILSVEEEDYFCKRVINAGSVFIGNYSPESAGDYASGTNHTLPTSGFARMYSGVSLDSFVKKISFQKISREGLKRLSPTIMTMAVEERLDAHKNAVEIRVKF